MRRILVVCGIGSPADPAPKPVLKLDVLDAEMVHPGWMRFRLEASAPDWEEPTVCWYRVPEGMSVELQSQVEDADVLARLDPPVVDVTPDPRL